MVSLIDRICQSGSCSTAGSDYLKYIVLELSLHEFVSSHNYDLVVSLWRSGEVRLSSDTRLSIVKNQKVALFFELVDECKELFILTNLVHR